MTSLDKPSRPPLHPEALRSEGRLSYGKIDLGAFEEDDTAQSNNITEEFPTVKVVIKPSRLGKLSPIVEELGRSESSDTAWRRSEQSRAERSSPFLESESALEPIKEARDDVDQVERTKEADILDKESSVTLKFSNRFEPRSRSQSSAKGDRQREGGDSFFSSAYLSGKMEATSIAGGPMFQKAALKLKEKRKTSQLVGDSIDPVIEPTTLASSVRTEVTRKDPNMDEKQQLQESLASLEKTPFDEPKSTVEDSKNGNKVGLSQKTATSVRPENPRRNVWNQAFWPQDASASIDSLFQKAVDPDGQLQRAMTPPIIDSPPEKRTTNQPLKDSEHFASSTKQWLEGQRSVTPDTQDGDQKEKLCIGDDFAKRSDTSISERERQQRIATLRAQRIKRQHHDASPVPSEGSASSTTTRADTILFKDMESRTTTKLFSVDPPSSSEVEDPRMARLLALRAKRQSMLSSHNFVRQLDGITDRTSSNSDECKESDTEKEQGTIKTTNLESTTQRVTATVSKMNVENEASLEMPYGKQWSTSSQGDFPEDGFQANQKQEGEMESTKVSEPPIQNVQAPETAISMTDHVDTSTPFSPSSTADSSLVGLGSSTSEMKPDQIVNGGEKSDGYGTDASGNMQIIDIISVGTSDCTLASAEQDPIIIVESDGDSVPHLLEPRKASIDCADSRVIRITPSLENMKGSGVVNLAQSSQGHHAEPVTIDLVSLGSVDGKVDPGGSHLHYKADPPSLSDIEGIVKENNKRKDPEQESLPLVREEHNHTETRRASLPSTSNFQSHQSIDESSSNHLEVQSVIDLIRMEDELEDQRRHHDQAIRSETNELSPKALSSSLAEPMSPVITESKTPEAHDSPFENVRRRLVQLNIEDFRTVVMEGVKTHYADLDKRLSEMVNEDDEGQKVQQTRKDDNTKEDSSQNVVSSINPSIGNGSTSKEINAPSKRSGMTSDTSRVPTPGSIGLILSNSRVLGGKKGKSPDEKGETDSRVRKGLQTSAQRENNDTFDDKILDELADLESVSDPIPKPNLSSTVESILDKADKSNQRPGPRLGSAVDSLMGKTDDDSSFRSGKRPPNMHVRFGDSSEFGLKSDLTESYMDLHMQDDGTNASTKSIETMDSDLDTLYESSTVPLLVRMLDRGCAWLEDSQACGADSKPSLLRETRVPPVDKRLVSNKKRPGQKTKALKTKEAPLPANLPKSSPRSFKKSSNAKSDSTLPPKQVRDKAARTDGQISTQGSVATPQKSMRKARKGPRSRKKARNLFALPLFKSGINGEYKLSRGFFSKASDSSSLETSTDSSSYENPIRVDGIVETSSESQDGERSRFEKYKVLKARQKYETRSAKRNAGDAETNTPITNVQKGPPSPERGRLVSGKRSFQFLNMKSERTDQSVIDVTDMTLEKAEMTLSPRMQGLPPTPTGSNISRAFQDKLQQRLTRVRDASFMLAEEDSGESSKSRQIHEQQRDSVEEIRRVVETRGGQDPPEAHDWSRKNAVSPRRNQKQSQSKVTDHSPPDHQVESTNVDDPSESDRLAALALAEKLRLRASELKEKRRKSNVNSARTSSQLNKPPSLQIKV